MEKELEFESKIVEEICRINGIITENGKPKLKKNDIRLFVMGAEFVAKMDWNGNRLDSIMGKVKRRQPYFGK